MWVVHLKVCFENSVKVEHTNHLKGKFGNKSAVGFDCCTIKTSHEASRQHR